MADANTQPLSRRGDPPVTSRVGGEIVDPPDRVRVDEVSPRDGASSRALAGGTPATPLRATRGVDDG